jgi:hypothetical protein
MPTAVTNYTNNNWITKVGTAGIIRQHGGLLMNYWNRSTTLAIMPGEPIIINQMVCVCSKLILPSSMGEVYTNWICDFRMNPAHTGDVLANDQLWWSYDVEALQDNVGCAVASAPTNGFILGRAVAKFEDPLNGSNQRVVASTTSRTWVRVASLQEPVVAIGTLPVFF